MSNTQPWYTLKFFVGNPALPKQMKQHPLEIHAQDLAVIERELTDHASNNLAADRYEIRQADKLVSKGAVADKKRSIGRQPVRRACPKCGSFCDSAVAAREHCRAKDRKNRLRSAIENHGTEAMKRDWKTK